MARYTGPVCRLCRREGRKLYLKGQRCTSPKCAVEKRPYPPGQLGEHGRRRRRRTDYAVQLRTKQAIRTFYGLLEGQFRRYVSQAERMPGVPGDNLLALLETRLDSVVSRAGLVASRAQARQLIGQRHFEVNGRVVTVASYRVRPGEVVAVREKSRNLPPIVEAVEVAARVAPRWLEVDYERRTAKVVNLPAREDVDVPGDEQVVVEFYSR